MSPLVSAQMPTPGWHAVATPLVEEFGFALSMRQPTRLEAATSFAGAALMLMGVTLDAHRFPER